MKVACGIMYDNANKILMGLRNERGANPNYWEFPGGKCEKNESLEECLKREWLEELNLNIDIQKELITTNSDNVECHFFIGKIKNLGNLHVNVHQYVAFYDVNDLSFLRLFPGDEKLIPLLKN